MAQDSVLIIGSGLAGMSAAVELAEQGRRVRVLEANPFLGGRTASWVQDGMPIESGFHRYLGFYTALPDILKKVGVSLDDILCWEDEIEVRVADGPHATLGLAPLHKPLKTFWDAFGHNDFLSPADKLSLGKMFAAGAKDYVSDPQGLDQITVTEYARRHDVTQQALSHMLVPLTEGIFFMPIERYSMYNLMGLFMPYLKTLPKLRVGAFTGGMSEVMMKPMADFVTAHGGVIETGVRVNGLLVEGGKVVGAVADAQNYHADTVVLAASLKGAKDILSADFGAHASLKSLFDLPTMPAATFQIELTEPAMELDRTTFGPGTVLSSFAEQSRTTFQQSKGRLSIILASPEEHIKKSPDEIMELVARDVKKLGLDLDGKVNMYRKVNLPDDFYSLATGSEALRPGQETDIPGLVLAGDYTKQPYLATMEGAVVSGKLAAELIVK